MIFDPAKERKNVIVSNPCHIDLEQLICRRQIRLHHDRRGVDAANSFHDCRADCVANLSAILGQNPQKSMEKPDFLVICELCAGADVAIYGFEIHFRRQRDHHSWLGADFNGAVWAFFLWRQGEVA